MKLSLIQILTLYFFPFLSYLILLFVGICVSYEWKGVTVEVTARESIGYGHRLVLKVDGMVAIVRNIDNPTRENVPINLIKGSTSSG